MSTNEAKPEVIADETDNKGGGEVEVSDTISVSKKDYEKMNQDLGSLKREIKDLKKPKEEAKGNTESKSDDNRLLEKMEKLALRTAGVTHPDDIKLAQDTAKKWGSDIDDVLTDDDFKVKLERQQTKRSNIEATADVKGSGSGSSAKMTPEYWIAKGTPPTAAEVPDRKLRAKIARAFIAGAKNHGKKFYND